METTRIAKVKDANVHSVAHWHMNNITAEDVRTLDVMNKISSVLDLLRMGEDVSMNIEITIIAK
jgi:hypothetical protein